MWRAYIDIASPHDPVRLLVRITHGLVHNGGSAIHNRRHRWNYWFLTERFLVLNTTSTGGGTLRPITQYPSVFELLGCFTFWSRELVRYAWILTFTSEYYLIGIQSIILFHKTYPLCMNCCCWINIFHVVCKPIYEVIPSSTYASGCNSFQYHFTVYYLDFMKHFMSCPSWNSLSVSIILGTLHHGKSTKMSCG